MKHELTNPRTYIEYKALIEELLLNGRTTGPVQSEAKIGYTRLNRQRMNRLDKTVQLSGEIRNAVQNVQREMTWLVFDEAWCGDGAQSVPVIEKIAAENDKIKTTYLLRDENHGLIEELLGKPDLSIPKVVAIDTVTSEVIGTWGSRPRVAQEFLDKLKADDVGKDTILEEMQRWYNADKGRTLQEEFVILLNRWNTISTAAAAN